MLKRTKSKYLFAIFIDFVFIALIFSFVIGAVFLTNAFLYPEKNTPTSLLIRTEYMPSEYRGALSVGDEVFDTLTKRKVGLIREARISQRKDEICFYITIDANFTPCSRALRTKELWFYFAKENE